MDSSSQLISVVESEENTDNHTDINSKGGSETNSLLRDLIKELQITNQYLKNVDSNTKESVKEMVWYEKRPDLVDVYIRVSFVSVGDIDAVKQEFQCEFYMQIRWTEPHLVGKTNSNEVDWENLWDPNIYINDVVSFDVHERSQRLVPADTYGMPPDVVQYLHIKGTFKEVEINPTFLIVYSVLIIFFVEKVIQGKLA